jgi:hypothetical protein
MAELNDLPDELLLKILMEVDRDNWLWGGESFIHYVVRNVISGSGGSAVHNGIGQAIIADIGRLERRFTRLGRQRGS